MPHHQQAWAAACGDQGCSGDRQPGNSLSVQSGLSLLHTAVDLGPAEIAEDEPIVDELSSRLHVCHAAQQPCLSENLWSCPWSTGHDGRDFRGSCWHRPIAQAIIKHEVGWKRGSLCGGHLLNDDMLK